MNTTRHVDPLAIGTGRGGRLPSELRRDSRLSRDERLARFVCPSEWGDISEPARESQIVQLECLRRGIWGTKSLWGRVVTYPGA